MDVARQAPTRPLINMSTGHPSFGAWSTLNTSQATPVANPDDPVTNFNGTGWIIYELIYYTNETTFFLEAQYGFDMPHDGEYIVIYVPDISSRREDSAFSSDITAWRCAIVSKRERYP